MKREKLIFVVVFMVCSFAVGTVFAAPELQKPNWCVVDCGFSVTMTSGTCRLDTSLGPLSRHDEWMVGVDKYILESGFYQINYSSWVANPTFVFDDNEISTTTIKFKLNTGSNPDWTQYRIAYSTAVNPSGPLGLFTGTTYYIKNGSIDWNPASFYEGVELTSLKSNTIYGFKIISRIPPPEQKVSTDWSVNADSYTWTHIEKPVISSVMVYITSATVTIKEDALSNLGAEESKVCFGKKIGASESWESWTTQTSYAFTGLFPNTAYIFMVKARNGQQYETGVSSTTKCTLCYPPTDPKIPNVTSTSLTLVWSSPSLGTVEYYQIRENGDIVQEPYTQISATKFSLDRTNLPCVNDEYIYQIYSVNKDSAIAPISSVTISTYTKCSIPPAPEISGVSADTISIGIDRGNNPSYTEFSIKVSSGPGSAKFVLDDRTVGGIEWFYPSADWRDPLTIKGLGSNVKYDISVQARNWYGNVTGYGASVSSCTYAMVPALAIEELITSSVRITILEGNNSPQTEYAIYEGVDDGFGYQGRGYLQPDGSTDPFNVVWQTKADWEANGGFIVPDLRLMNYGYRFRAQARRTIAGYSKEPTGWSSYAYAGKVVNPPIAEIDSVVLSAGTTVYYISDSTVTFTASGADEIHYTYTINGLDPDEPTTSHPGGSPPVRFALTASELERESNTYRIRAKAWKGTGPEALASEVGGVWIVVIDRDPPTIDSFSIVEGAYTTNSKITLEISATGADEMYIDGDVVNDLNTFEWINYSTRIVVYLTPGDGEKQINVKVRDKAGNVVGPVPHSITLQQNPPGVNFRIVEAIPIGWDVFVSTPVITLEISYSNADEVKIEGDVIGPNINWWMDLLLISPFQLVTLKPGDGEKTVTVTVRMKNIPTGSRATKSDYITLDTIVQNPTLILSDQDSGKQDYTNDPKVTVSIPSLDTDVKYYILSETQATKPSATAAWRPVPIPSTFDLLVPGDGPKTVYLWVKDRVDNINVGISSATITLDRQGPGNTDLRIDGGRYTNSQVVTLKISATGADYMYIGGDVEDTGSTMDWISYSTSTQVTLTTVDESKKVTIRFKDEAGNETPQSPAPPIEYSILLDKTSPVIEGSIEAWLEAYGVKLEEGEVNTCHCPTFKFAASDNLSGVNRYSYSFSTNQDLDPDNAIHTTTNSIQLELGTLDNDGTYYFKVKAIDNAGNPSGVKSFAYKYKADFGAPEATINVEGKETIGNEVVGVKRTALPEILFNEEVLGVQSNVEVELIRNNEGEDTSGNVSCAINDEGEGLWKIDPEKDWESNYTYRVKLTKDGIVDKANNTLKEEKELIFTTMLDRTKRNVVMWESEKKTKMILEANALKEDGFVSINLEPLPLKGTGAREAKEVNKEAIIEADEKMKRSGDRYCYNLRESMREISGYTMEGGEMVLDKFLNTVYIELPYGDENNNGIVDSTEGSSEPVSEKTLSVYWLDEEHRLWVKVAGTEVDKKGNITKAKVIGFGVYTLMGGSFYDLSDAHAYPVPYKPNDGLSTTGDETSGITFTNLSTEAEIKIYTISGELVKKLIHKDGWDEEWYPVENEKGEKVVSGVYIYYITNQKQHKSGKLVIIR